MEPLGLTGKRIPSVGVRDANGSDVSHTVRYMLTVPEAASRLGQDRETVRRWIRSGRLRARNVAGRYAVELHALRAVVDELFPMAELPDE